MANINVMFSHKHDDWQTPVDIYNLFMQHGFIDCFKFHSEYDELDQEYFGKRLFVNPPYSNMKQVSKWIIKQFEHNEIYLLVPARTDTQWFFDIIINCQAEIIFIKGRLKFNDIGNAPFPSMLIHLQKGTMSNFVVCKRAYLVDVLRSYYL